MRYRVEKLLGEGGMGRVFQAWDELRQRRVALKALISFRDAAALAEEFQLLTRLSHSNLVEIYDFHPEVAEVCAAEGLRGPCFSMEYLEGHSLERLAEKPSSELSVQLFTQGLSGLNYLHARGLLHRDLKPANLFLKGNGGLKLLDFGLAGEAETEGAPRGTLAYQAPEALWGSYEARSDLFSFGVLSYELCTGQMPFSPWPPQSAAALPAPTPLQKLCPDLPGFLADAIHWLLQASPSDRPSSALAVLQYLRRHGVELGPLSTESTALPARLDYQRPQPLFSLAESALQATEGKSAVEILLLHGISGIGRSRFLEELRWRFQLQGGTWVGLRPESAVDWLRLARQSLHGPEAILSPSLPESIELLFTQIDEQTAVLACEDLALWPETALQELRLLIRSWPKEKTSLRLILETRSDGDLSNQDRFWRELSSHPKAKLLELSPLEDAQAEALLRSAPLDTPILERWLRQAVKQCGGHPLLLLETLRQGLAEEFQGAPETPSTLPEQILASCRRRWQGLSSGAQRCFLLALAKGNSVDLMDLRTLWPESAGDFAAALWELERQGLLRRNPDRPQFRDLAQASLRPVWLEIFPDEDLTKAHRTWLERLLLQAPQPPRPDPIAVEIAEQALGAQDPSLSKTWGLNAAEYCENQNQPAAALQWYQRLLPLAAGPEDRYLLQGSMAPLFYRLGHLQEARHAYELWYQDRPDDETRLQRAKFFFYTSLVDFADADFVAARAGFESCLRVGPAGKYSSHHPYHARSLNFLAAMARRECRFEAARGLLQRAAQLAGSDPLLVGDVEQRRGELELGQLRFSPALEHFRRCREAFQKSGSAQSQAVAHHLLALWAREFGRPREARVLIEQALHLAQSSGAVLQGARYQENRALMSLELGDYETAWRDMERAERVIEVYGTEEDLQLLKLHRADFHARTGRSDQAESLLRALESLSSSDGKWASEFALRRGEISLRAGRVDEAKSSFQNGLAVASSSEPAQRLRLLWGLCRTQALKNQLASDSTEIQETLALIQGLEGPFYPLIGMALRCWTATASDLREDLPTFLSALQDVESAELKMDLVKITALLLTQRGLRGVSEGLWKKNLSEWRRFAAQLPEVLKMDMEKNRPNESLDAELMALLADSQAPADLAITRTETPPPPQAQIPVAAQAPSGLSEQRFRQFSEISRQIAGKHDLGEILERVMDAAIEFTGAERGFLILENPASKAPLPGFEVKTARHFNQKALSSQDLQISMTAARQAMDQGSPLLTANAQLDERLKEKKSVVQYQLKSILSVPLELEGKVLGAIYLDHRYAPNAFREEDIVFLGAFSAQAALAVQKARLIAELKTANAKLEEKVESQEQRIAILSDELAQVRDELRYGYDEIVGQSPGMMELFHILDHVTDTLIPVWIFGESGTGKELVARSLHQNSTRKKGPYVTINCSAIPETLLESELFGHKRGAFTHADRDKPGLFEAANGGTLFMDEVADMSPSMQVKLLRVLQDGEVRPVGANKPVKIDVRLVTASNKDLQQLVDEEKFRQDLFFRINGITVRLPPLRERKEDIPLLVNHLIQKLAKAFKLEACKVSEEAYEKMVAYSWPGNIRQMESVLRNAMLFAQGKAITAPLLSLPAPSEARAAGPSASAGDPKSQEKAEERRLIVEALRRHQMNKPAVAEELGITLRCLYLRMDRHRIPKGKTVLAKYLGIKMI